MMLNSSTDTSVGKLQAMQHVLHDVLAIADDDGIILLVKQENLQSVEELTLLVFQQTGRSIVITMERTPRLLWDVLQSRLVQLTCFGKYLLQNPANNHFIA